MVGTSLYSVDTVLLLSVQYETVAELIETRLLQAVAGETINDAIMLPIKALVLTFVNVPV